ncbi:MAG: MoxR family ATPase [Bacteroidia bacterium]
MVQKYWVMFYIDEGVFIDPRFKIDKKLSFKDTSLKPIENFWLKVTTIDNMIVSVDENCPMEEFISLEKINELIKENSIIMTAEQNKKITSQYLKPVELFIPEMNWNLINTTIDLKKYPLLIGPKGCGKTQTAQSIAKARGMKFYPINCGSIFKPKQTLVGQMQAKDGTTFLLSSEFLTYFTDDCEEGVLIFLDEISRIPQGAANYFMTILDRIQSYIYIEEEGRQVYRGKNVVFVAAANFGYEYSDTRNLDGALIDRFMKFIIDYLPEKDEIELIQQRVPTAVPTDIKRLVKYATMFRENAEKLRIAVSTRQLIDMAEYLPKGYDIKTIFDNIFINLFVNGSMDERDTVNKMIDANM